MTAAHPLKTWRDSRGLTQTALALLLGVRKNSVHRYERGERFPRPRILARIETVTAGAITARDFLPLKATEAAE